MIRKVASQLVPLTRQLAQDFAKMRSVPGERQRKTSRESFFLAHLKAGTFHSPTWSQALIGDDPVPYRADGQHTSFVCATCDEDLLPRDLPATIHTWHLDSKGELSDLFDLFDNPRAARSNTDKMGVHAAEYDDLLDVDRSFLVKAAHGIDYCYRCEQGQLNATPVKLYGARDFGLYYIDEPHRQFALWLYQFHNAHPNGWMLNKSGIVAEMFADWRAYPIISAQFWSYVILENHPDNEDDTRELARTFVNWNNKQPAHDPEQYMMKAKKFWERYRRGQILAKMDDSQAA